jgi:hypothetical protein
MAPKSKLGLWLRLASGVFACVLFVLTWMPPPYSALHYALISALEPPLPPLLVAAGGLLSSRLLLRGTEPWLPLGIGTALCWAALLGSVLTLGYLQLIKFAMLL